MGLGSDITLACQPELVEGKLFSPGFDKPGPSE
jgi:hypothetical protein